MQHSCEAEGTMGEHGGVKITIDAPQWVSDEERAWALSVAELVYSGTESKYIDRSSFKKDIAEGRSKPFFSDKDKKSISETIEIIKVTWDCRTVSSDGVRGDIIFQIVVGIPGLEKFTVYISYWGMNKRMFNRYWITRGYENRARVHVSAETSVGRVNLGPLPDGEVDPATMARACIAGIETGVYYRKYILMLDLKTLDEIQALLLPRERETEYPRVEVLSDRLPEMK